ncbi:MAG TPA: hypothetical protein VFW23_08120 [Tepidisphaeraceae bacterium]|nr:hypothetical protein [Tepidisphaeraceae bacterium]
MGRPVEYTRARRMAMQAVLTLVLGISILLAWLMSRAHAARIYPPNWETRKVGGFAIDVPIGWTASVIRPRVGSYIAVDEPGQKRGRQLHIIDEPFKDEGQSSLDVAMNFFNDEFPADEFQNIDLLGQKGVWIEVPTEISGDTMRPGYLAAFALLPSNRLLLVKMTGPPIFVPGDIQLFKRFVQSLKDLHGKGQTVARSNPWGLKYVSDDSSGSSAS